MTAVSSAKRGSICLSRSKSGASLESAPPSRQSVSHPNIENRLTYSGRGRRLAAIRRVRTGMALKGTNQEHGRPYNRRIVLETIRVHGPIARGEIAKRVGLTVQTVSTIIRELEAQGFLLAAREEQRRRGYPATELSINPDGGHA